MNDSISAPTAHVGRVVASTIRPDLRPANAADSHLLWVPFGGLALLALAVTLFSRFFPPDIGLGLPAVDSTGDHYTATSQITNHTIHPVELRLRFKIFPADPAGRRPGSLRAFGVKEITLTVPGTANSIARCEFPRTAASPNAVAAEVMILSK